MTEIELVLIVVSDVSMTKISVKVCHTVLEERRHDSHFTDLGHWNRRWIYTCLLWQRKNVASSLRSLTRKLWRISFVINISIWNMIFKYQLLSNRWLLRLFSGQVAEQCDKMHHRVLFIILILTIVIVFYVTW